MTLVRANPATRRMSHADAFLGLPCDFMLYDPANPDGAWPVTAAKERAAEIAKAFAWIPAGLKMPLITPVNQFNTARARVVHGPKTFLESYLGAFGANAAADYNGATRVIRLTESFSTSVFIHEWAHHIDFHWKYAREGGTVGTQISNETAFQNLYATIQSGLPNGVYAKASRTEWFAECVRWLLLGLPDIFALSNDGVTTPGPLSAQAETLFRNRLPDLPALTTASLPTFSTHPASPGATVAQGATISLTAATTGGFPATTIQWQYSPDGNPPWADWYGKLGPALSFPVGPATPLVPGNKGWYRASAANPAGLRQSNPVFVNVDTAFVSGVTEPYYVPTSDFSGAKNVGNTATARTAFGSTVTNGVTQLTGLLYENLNFINTVVEPRGNGVTVFRNCRFFMDGGYTAADSLRAMVRILNGAGTTEVQFEDCEFHNRAQRVMNGIQGRNGTVRRSVFTGTVDGVSCSTSGSVPQNKGIDVYDSWIGELAWWMTAATPWEGHGTDATHNDARQVATTLGSIDDNVVFGATISELVGTGTPGSGSETNPYSANYIDAQATQNARRAANTVMTTAAQSFKGVSRRIATNGSMASGMFNRGNISQRHCYYYGGTVGLNIVDAALPSTPVISVKQGTFHNDMLNGHGGNPATKGHAILLRSGLTVDIPTSGADRNLWSDGSTVTPNVL